LIHCEANRVKHVAHGVIHASERLSLAERLLILDAGLTSMLAEHKPDAASVETLFFHKDPQAASKLGHARGVVLLSLARAGVTIGEYAPALVKSALTGNGRAEKTQVAQMIRMILCLDTVPEADAADALALALTHIRRAPLDAQLAARAAANPALMRLLKPKRAPRTPGPTASRARAKPIARRGTQT
jgi:crossover junction endodeoxyribonuclease RuvC